jgi:putative ABC transport system permease protein
VVRSLHRKLLRDLWRMRYQVVTIAILVGCGIAAFISTVAAASSMGASRDAFYADARLADIFCRLKRAPRSVLDQLRDLSGVATVDGRVVDDFRIEMDGTNEPIGARFVSIAAPQADHLNQVRLRAGRQIEAANPSEVLVGAAFAEAWGLSPGAELTAVVNEHKARLRVVGVAVSPEFAFTAGPRTGLPDPRHFGVVWMDEDALAKATGFVGAFNDVSLRLVAGADAEETIRRVDWVLDAYGGLGAISRSNQPSAKLVEQKIAQLHKLSTTLPTIFLGVAVFLLNILLSRIVGTQREQIATIKALGYRTRDLSWHFAELALVICSLGALIGIVLGVAGARGMLVVYAQYFKFPIFLFRLPAWPIAGATLVSLTAGLLGSLLGVRRAVAVPPAEAMRPEAPPSYHASRLDRFYRALSPIARMVVRDFQRKPVRLLLSSFSIALATALVLVGSAFGDSIGEVLQLEFEVSQREQVTVSLDRPRDWRAVSEAMHIPGVVNVEGERHVPVRIRKGPLSRSTALLGFQSGMDLHRLLGADRRPLRLPASGLSLSRVLADSLNIRSGDEVEIDILEGSRKTLVMPVAALVDDLLGLSAYMPASELARLLDETARVDILRLAADDSDVDAVLEGLRKVPAAISVSRPAVDRGLVRAEVADEITALSVLLAILASAIAVGIVYNNARIALEVRSRDLATMRILGFTRGELAAVLLGEQVAQVLLGIVPGLALGAGMAKLGLSTIDRELLRIPLMLRPPSYVAAVCVVAFAALWSALAVRRRSDRLDLVAVLKARD